MSRTLLDDPMNDNDLSEEDRDKVREWYTATPLKLKRGRIVNITGKSAKKLLGALLTFIAISERDTHHH
jgi:hypothetical protein